jgi:molecular chaperone HtpG
MTEDQTNPPEEKRKFEAEVSKLLHIVANSLYSDKDVFLRELISNASDACDKLRYEAITKPELIKDDPEFRIEFSVNAKKRTLTISDNGIGMNHDDLVDNLGTIARSGSGKFVEELAESDDAVSLIGQFGVGFYSAFMVAEQVSVTSRRAGKEDAFVWSSDGLGEFTVMPATRETRGTTIEMKLKKDAKKYAEVDELRRIVKTYSDHIGLPIVLKSEGNDETLNAASALWTRAKKDISEDQYREFYHHVSHSFDEPWMTIHAHVEGKIEFRLLLYVPTQRPFDLFDPARKHQVKLYVKRVFITDECEGLIPPYLRFLRGIVDSEDLALNVSRELLQSSPMVTRIRKDITKRLFRELDKKAKKDKDGFIAFWKEFGAVLKEGLYEDGDAKEGILKIARFTTTAGSELASLEEYVGRMKEGQTGIYYLSGSEADVLAKSPLLEGYRARGLEVLLLSDPVDDFWIPTVNAFDEKTFQSIARGDAGLDDIPLEKSDDDDKKTDEAPAEGMDSLIALLKLDLGDAVKDVRTSTRLTDSPVCLVADESGVDMHLERLLKQHGRIDSLAAPILEINADHDLIKALAAQAGKPGATDDLADAAQLLFDQARIAEGELPVDPAAFSRRIAAVMAKGLLKE